MADNLLFFTELMGMPVLDLKGRRIGRVKDAALVPLEHASRIDRYLVGGGDAWLTVRYDQIRSISLDQGIELSDEQLTPYHDDEYMLRIARDLLDQQIIDVNGRKVVRVNDVTMEIRHDGRARHRSSCWRWISASAASSAGCCRAPCRARWIRRLQQPIPPNSIRWEFCNVVEPDPLRRLRLNISYQQAGRDASGRPGRHRRGPEPGRARGHLRNHRQRGGRRRALRSRSQDAGQHSGIAGAGKGRRHRGGDGARTKPPTRSPSWKRKPPRRSWTRWIRSPRPRCEELLEFEEDTAGGMMNTEYVALPENATVTDALAALKGNEDLLENLNTLFLVDGEERLTAADPAGAAVSGLRRRPAQGAGQPKR